MGFVGRTRRPPPTPPKEEKKDNLYLRETLTLRALRQAQDRRRGDAPLHTPLRSLDSVSGSTQLRPPSTMKRVISAFVRDTLTLPAGGRRPSAHPLSRHETHLIGTTTTACSWRARRTTCIDAMPSGPCHSERTRRVWGCGVVHRSARVCGPHPRCFVVGPPQHDMVGRTRFEPCPALRALHQCPALPNSACAAPAAPCFGDAQPRPTQRVQHP